MWCVVGWSTCHAHVLKDASGSKLAHSHSEYDTPDSLAHALADVNASKGAYLRSQHPSDSLATSKDSYLDLPSLDKGEQEEETFDSIMAHVPDHNATLDDVAYVQAHLRKLYKIRQDPQGNLLDIPHHCYVFQQQYCQQLEGGWLADDTKAWRSLFADQIDYGSLKHDLWRLQDDVQKEFKGDFSSHVALINKDNKLADSVLRGAKKVEYILETLEPQYMTLGGKSCARYIQDCETTMARLREGQRRYQQG